MYDLVSRWTCGVGDWEAGGYVWAGVVLCWGHGCCAAVDAVLMLPATR